MTDRSMWKHANLSDRVPWRIAQVELHVNASLHADTLEESAHHCHQAWVHVHALERTLRLQDSTLLWRLYGRGWSQRQIKKMAGITDKTLARRLAHGRRLELRRQAEAGET